MKKIYVIYDNLAKMSSDPFCAPNDDVAQRTYGCWCAQHSEIASDSQLNSIGLFDEEKANISEVDASYVVTTYNNYFEKVKRNE